MKKVLTITNEAMIVLRRHIRNVIKSKTEDDVMMRYDFFKATNAVKEIEKRIAESQVVELDTEEQAAAKQKDQVLLIEECKVEQQYVLEDDLVTWIKAKHKEIPTEIKFYNKEGEMVGEGLNSESDVENYVYTKKRLEDVRVYEATV